MIRFLTNHFIKNKEDVKDPQVRQAYGALCGCVGILLNILLFTGKFLAGFLSNSIAITADAFNNLSDAASSVITLLGFKLSNQKPDPGHPYGHGRIEYLSGLFVSIAVLITAFELVKSSFEKILHPQLPAFSPAILVILGVSILIKLYMAYYNRTISKKISSAAMNATAVDSLSDAAATGFVLIATLAGKLTGFAIDGYCGLLVGLFIFYAGIQAARETINPLLGQPPEKEFVNRIQEIVMSFPGILGIHDLMIHDYGPGRVMISLHAEVDAASDILQAHDTIDNIEKVLQNSLNCVAVIHMDPVCVGDPETERLKAQVQALVHRLSPEISIHDFRIVKGPTHTNLIFDALVPYSLKLEDETVRGFLCDGIGRFEGNYYAVINVDKDYC